MILLIICCLFIPNVVLAEPYYKDKVIKLIVPHGPGGGADLVSRMIARHLPKHIPGNPLIVLRYMLGGLGITASNYFHNSAPKDGLTIMTGSGPVALNALLRLKGVNYDPDKFLVFLACPMGEVFYTRTNICSKREDFFEKSEDLVFGSGPMPYPLTIHFELAKKVFNFETKKDILAYNTAEGIRAFLGEEIDIATQGIGSYVSVIYPLVKKGEVLPLWQSGIASPDGKIVRLPAQLADVPTVAELYKSMNGRDPSGEYWEALSFYITYVRTFNKPIMLPPGTEEYLTILSEAGAKMRKDPEFLKEANKILVGAPVYSGKEAMKIRRQLREEGEKTKEWIRNWLKTEYNVKTQ